MYVNHLAALFLCLQAFCSCFEQAKYFDFRKKKKRQLLNAVNAVQFFLILVIRNCCVISSERCVH